MEDTYRVSVRLASDTYDFNELIPDLSKYKVIYYKKGESLTKDGSFKARANVLIINDFCVVSTINEENNTMIINRLIPLIKELSVIDVLNLTREIYITGSIENEQFGFIISFELINLLAENKYKLSFSGISYL